MKSQIAENGVEYIEFDGIQLPVYRTDPEDLKKGLGGSCLNCSWHHLSEDERQAEIDRIEAMLDREMEKMTPEELEHYFNAE